MALSLGLLVVQNLVAVDSAQAGEAKASWQADWEKTVKAAEKEGEIVVYCTDGLDLVFREGLQRKYSKIKVTTLIGRGFELGQRVMSERRAGKYIPDVFAQGSTTPVRVLYSGKALVPIRPALILPEVIDTSKWWQGKHHYVDPENN